MYELTQGTHSPFPLAISLLYQIAAPFFSAFHTMATQYLFCFCFCFLKLAAWLIQQCLMWCVRDLWVAISTDTSAF